MHGQDKKNDGKLSYVTRSTYDNKNNLIREEFDKIALQRAEILIQAHERFRKVMGGKRYKAVEPVLPMDLMGVYILLPDRTSSIKKSGFLKKPDF